MTETYGANWSISDPYHQTFNTDEFDWFSDIATDAQGNSYVVFTSTTPNQEEISLITVMKVDNTGKVLWATSSIFFNLRLTAFNIFPTISIDGAGNSYIAYYTLVGEKSISDNYYLNVVVFSLDTNGNNRWVRNNNVITYANGKTVTDNLIILPTQNISNLENLFSFVAEFSLDISTDPYDNSYIVYADQDYTIGFSRIRVFKINQSGFAQWYLNSDDINQTVTDSFGDMYIYNNGFPEISTDCYGNCYICFQRSLEENNQGSTQGFLLKLDLTNVITIKLDPFGNIKWFRQIELVLDPFGLSNPHIATTPAGDVYVLYDAPMLENNETFVTKLDTNGTFLWNTYENFQLYENQTLQNGTNGTCIAVDCKGNCFFTMLDIEQNYTSISATLNPHVYIVKLNSDGVFEWINNQFYFNSLYNQENSQATVRIALDKKDNIYTSLTIFAPNSALNTNEFLSSIQNFINRLDKTDPGVTQILVDLNNLLVACSKNPYDSQTVFDLLITLIDDSNTYLSNNCSVNALFPNNCFIVGEILLFSQNFYYEFNNGIADIVIAQFTKFFTSCVKNCKLNVCINYPLQGPFIYNLYDFVNVLIDQQKNYDQNYSESNNLIQTKTGGSCMIFNVKDNYAYIVTVTDSTGNTYVLTPNIDGLYSAVYDDNYNQILNCQEVYIQDINRGMNKKDSTRFHYLTTPSVTTHIVEVRLSKIPSYKREVVAISAEPITQEPALQLTYLQPEGVSNNYVLSGINKSKYTIQNLTHIALKQAVKYPLLISVFYGNTTTLSGKNNKALKLSPVQDTTTTQYNVATISEVRKKIAKNTYTIIT